MRNDRVGYVLVADCRGGEEIVVYRSVESAWHACRQLRGWDGDRVTPDEIWAVDQYRVLLRLDGDERLEIMMMESRLEDRKIFV